jgi:hypothetical protein
MADARGVRRRVPIAALVQRRVELRQLEASVAVWGLHDRGLCPDALEPHDTVHPPALDRPLALQLESERDEELSRGCEIVNDDAHMGGDPSVADPHGVERIATRSTWVNVIVQVSRERSFATVTRARREPSGALPCLSE